MFTLRISVSALLVAAASLVTASPNVLHSNADVSDLRARQAPGTPQFDCHSNCGNALAGARVEGHCTNATWVGYYEKCLGCALEFDIWKHYSTGLTAGAGRCGLTPTPSPAPAATGTGAGAGASTAASGSVSRTITNTPTAPVASTGTSGTAAANTQTSTAGAPAFTTAAAGSMMGPGVLVAGALMFAAAL